MKKFITTLSLSAFIAISFSACGEQPKPNKKEEADFRCRIDGQLQPEWVCGNDTGVEGAYTAVASAPMSKMGRNFTQVEAIAQGRNALARTIEVKVKNKIEQFARSTGVGSSEVADKVSTQVSKQVANVTLSGSRMMKSRLVGNTLYVLVGVPEKSVNQTAKEAVKSSYKNDKALWQQFQAQKAQDSLDKEFPDN